MCNKTVDALLQALKLVLDWFFTKKDKKNDHAEFSKDHVIFYNADSGNVTFFSVEVGILSVDLPNINLDNVNFHEDDPETIIHVRLMTWHNTFKQLKACKIISKELMPLACHPTKWWD